MLTGICIPLGSKSLKVKTDQLAAICDRGRGHLVGSPLAQFSNRDEQVSAMTLGERNEDRREGRLLPEHGEAKSLLAVEVVQEGTRPGRLDGYRLRKDQTTVAGRGTSSSIASLTASRSCSDAAPTIGRARGRRKGLVTRLETALCWLSGRFAPNAWRARRRGVVHGRG